MNRTRSPRRLAGTRANKHRPIARRTRLSDRSDWYVGGWNWPMAPCRHVDITACFPGAAALGGRRGPDAARRAGDCGRFPAPMTASRRETNYFAQTGRRITDRQDRRIFKKARSVGEAL